MIGNTAFVASFDNRRPLIGCRSFQFSIIPEEILAMAVPKRVADRLSAGLKKFKPVIEAAKARDVNESDTSMIVTDMLADVFGFDKYNEITREYAIRGTYCDLATKSEGKLQTLIEVKAIGVTLRDSHMKQAVDYAANQGVEWVVLTNGQYWKVYSVSFSKPISADLVLDIDILDCNHGDEDAIEDLFLLSKEGAQKSGLDAYNDQLRVRSRFNLAAIILGDTVLHTIRRELKRLSPDVRISVEEIADALSHEVLKRDALEGDKATEAQKLVSRAASKALRQKKAKASEDGVVVAGLEASDDPHEPGNA